MCNWLRAPNPNAGHETVLHAAAREGCLEACIWAIDHGALVEARDRDGRRPLHVAALGKQEAVCKALFERGAATDAPDMTGRTAMQLFHQRRLFGM